MIPEEEKVEVDTAPHVSKFEQQRTLQRPVCPMKSLMGIQLVKKDQQLLTLPTAQASRKKAAMLTMST